MAHHEEVVDQMNAAHARDEAFSQVQRLQHELVELVRRTAAGTVTKIDLIRAYRNATGAGLKDSKDYVESLQPPPLPPSELSVITARLEVLEKWVGEVGVPRLGWIE